MSLKEFTKEIFTRYGLTEEDINVYLKYLRAPYATISEVFMYYEEGEIEYAKVEEITKKLVEMGFIKKIEGMVDRYIPLEPYFELFTNESEIFRNQIAEIKTAVLADQSNRFEKLEAIQNNSVREIDTAVDTQVNTFFKDSDNKNTDKKQRIDKATTRFKDTSKSLEKELHDVIEADYSRLTGDINRIDKESDDVWDVNSSKFKSDNDTLNKDLTEITQAQVKSSKGQESNIRNIIDALNSDLKNISSSFVGDNEKEINTAKDNITEIITDLLKDFSTRVDNLEKELKKDLDDHVDRHKNIANELKPKMEQILEKYLERMDKIVTDLKERISRLLTEHSNHLQNTTNNIESDIHAKVDNRHLTLKDQVNTHKSTALTLLENLLDSANRFSDFSEDMAKQGLFFFGGKKKKYVARWKQVEQDVASLSRPFKDNFVKDCNDYINETQKTVEGLKKDVSERISEENNSLSAETTDLDKKAQETLSAELDILARDMAGEIDNTLQSGVKDCSNTTIKLKDSLESSLTQHHKQYDDAINRHKDVSLRHYMDFDAEIKRKNENWIRDIDTKFSAGKSDISTEIETQIKTINSHLDKTKGKNIDHSKTFNDDVNEVKAKQRKIYDDLLNKVRSDSDDSKNNISNKIDAEINLWNEESADMDKMLVSMLEDHKTKYKENAETLQNSLTNTIRENTQNVKDAIADFTLQFMNSIDDSTEIAENNEEKLMDIFKASSSIQKIAKVTTWHTVGQKALISAIKDAVYRTKSSVIIITPIVVPEILQLISEFAYQRKVARFMLTSHWDMQAYRPIIKKMLQLGNIQFRSLSTPGEYFAVTRDAEEVILCPYTPGKDSDMISIVSNQEAYAKLYSQFIGPIFQANSRPIKL